MSKASAPVIDPQPAPAGNQDKLMEFYLTDFKDLSDKLEKTDNKIQFFVQLYIGIITASIALLAEKLILAGHYGLSGCFWLALGAMGYFVMEYVLSAFKLHGSYVNRLNDLRKNFLSQQGKNDGFIENYGYTEPIPPNSNGMTFWMIYFLQFTVSGFLGASVYCFAARSTLPDGNRECIAVAAVVLIYAVLYCLIRRRKKQMKAAYDKKYSKKDEQNGPEK